MSKAKGHILCQASHTRRGCTACAGLSWCSPLWVGLVSYLPCGSHLFSVLPVGGLTYKPKPPVREQFCWHRVTHSDPAMCAEYKMTGKQWGRHSMDGWKKKNTGDTHACLFSPLLWNKAVFKITDGEIIFNAAGSLKGEPCGKTCLEERDNQWLGVTLSRQPGENGSIVVGYWPGSTENMMESDTLGVTFTSFGLLLCFIQTCGHRWKNIFYIKNENKLPTGVCYGMPSDLRTELSKRIAPCYQGKAWFWY